MFGQFSPDVDEIKRTDGYDEYVGAQMRFDLGGETGLRGMVFKRAKGDDGNPIGTRNTRHTQIYCPANGWIRTGVGSQPNRREFVRPSQGTRPVGTMVPRDRQQFECT
jgi:hypothetical protein